MGLEGGGGRLQKETALVIILVWHLKGMKVFES